MIKMFTNPFFTNKRQLLIASIPVLLIGVVLLGATIFKMTAPPPEYDFVFARQDFDAELRYTVSNDRIELTQGIPTPAKEMLASERSIPPQGSPSSSPSLPAPDVVDTATFGAQLLRYDVDSHTTREISRMQANAYKLDFSREAPDGYRFQNYSDEGILSTLLISGRRRNAEPELVNEYKVVPLNIPDSESSTSIEFFGWIVEGANDE